MSEKIYIRTCKTVRKDGTIVITPWRQVVKTKILDPEVKERNKQLRAEKNEIKKQAKLDQKNKIKELKNELYLQIDKMNPEQMIALISNIKTVISAPEKAE